MKYIVLLCDGMGDEPIEELGGKTPLEYAKTPSFDKMAKRSEIGLACTIPEGMNPGSDTANLAVLGYDPEKYYSGRSPLEALSIGVDILKVAGIAEGHHVAGHRHGIELLANLRLAPVQHRTYVTPEIVEDLHLDVNHVGGIGRRAENRQQS